VVSSAEGWNLWYHRRFQETEERTEERRSIDGGEIEGCGFLGRGLGLGSRVREKKKKANCFEKMGRRVKGDRSKRRMTEGDRERRGERDTTGETERGTPASAS
jgi:hypothetical protein